MVSHRPRYPSIPALIPHALVEVGHDFPFPQSRAIGSRGLNVIVCNMPSLNGGSYVQFHIATWYNPNARQ